MEITGEVMVCISTRQNTANLIPCLQFDFDTVVIMETDHAQKQDWSKGLRTVLKNRGINVESYTLENGNNLSVMIPRVRGVADRSSRICWNIGGGQKMQQLALTRVFQERLEHGKNDWACYADPGTRSIYRITGDRATLQSEEIKVQTDVALDEVLTVFGLEKRKSNQPLCLWSSKTPDLLPDKKKFRDFSFFWEKDKRHQLLSWVVSDKKEQCPPVLAGLKHDYADFFEQVVQYEVAKILCKHGENHFVTEAWANVRVKDHNGKEIAEWDIVLVTEFGTLVILDAKTGLFHSKDEHARLYNLERATGFYGEFWLIIPYLYEDMEPKGFYSQQGRKGKEYRSVPFELDKLNSRFVAVSGKDVPLFLTKRKKENHLLFLDKPEQMDKTLEISSHLSLLEKLRLIKP